MQNRRSRVVWFVAIAVAFFFLVDPFRLFQSNNIPQMRVNSDIEKQMQSYLAEAASPEQYIVNALASHDLVMIGETGYVKQEVDTLVSLIPALDAAGIHYLGYQYAQASDQALIDKLVTADTFDETLANQILFNDMVIMGYEEYRNVFRAAWEVNLAKGPNDERFHVIGIDLSPDYTFVKEQADTENPDVLKNVFAKGIPDDVMARTILSQIVRPGNRGVVYTQLEHAFTDYAQPQYTNNMNKRGFPGERRAGNIIAEQLGDRVMTVVFHGPLQDTRSKIGYGYPVGGLMEKAAKTLDGRPVGFDVAGSPYADAPITSDVMTKDRKDLTLSQFTDGYIYFGPTSSFTPVTPIPDFITDANIAQARADFPGPDPGDVSVADMNDFIAGTATSMTRIFEKFK